MKSLNKTGFLNVFIALLFVAAPNMHDMMERGICAEFISLWLPMDYGKIL